MTPKIVLVTIGALMTLHGIGLYFSAGSIAEYTDPTEAMTTMSARLNESIGIMTLLVGVILLASFNIDSNSAKKVVPTSTSDSPQTFPPIFSAYDLMASIPTPRPESSET